MERLRNALAGQAGARMDAEEIVRKFVRQEEQHFALFQTVAQLKTQVANTETEILDMEGRLEKPGKADMAAAASDSHKAKAARELDERTHALEAEKTRIEAEGGAIEAEMQETLLAIRAVGVDTLQLEGELAKSVARQDLARDDVSAFMSAIELKVAELLIETGNQISLSEQHAGEGPSDLDFPKVPPLSEEEFAAGMQGDGQDDDVMFMSMQDFKKKLDLMQYGRGH